MATTTTSAPGRNLRAARLRVGLTRAQLAHLVGCSLAQLGNIEQGAVPKQSRVLEAAFAAIDTLDDERRPHQAAVVQEPAGQGRRASG